jgi:hypothetical protein
VPLPEDISKSMEPESQRQYIDGEARVSRNVEVGSIERGRTIVENASKVKKNGNVDWKVG